MSRPNYSLSILEMDKEKLAIAARFWGMLGLVLHIAVFDLYLCFFWKFESHRDRDLVVLLFPSVQKTTGNASLTKGFPELPRAFSTGFNSSADKCFKVKKFFTSRWGNQVVQLLRSLQLAEYFEIPTVIVRPGHAKLAKDMMYNDIKVVLDRGQTEACVVERCFFYESTKGIKEIQRLSFSVPYEFRVAYSEMLNVKPLGDNVLVIHIRSGDIMVKAHRSYAQPPCQYYFDVIGSRNWSEIRVISEDDVNPCVGILRNSSIPVYLGREFDVDLREMFGARNLVIGRGTLGFMVAVLSTNLRRIYTFNTSTTRFLRMTDIREHYNCAPSDSYFNEAVKKWTLSQRQLDLMHSGKCELWQDMRNISHINDVYIFEDVL